MLFLVHTAGPCHAHVHGHISFLTFMTSWLVEAINCESAVDTDCLTRHERGAGHRQKGTQAAYFLGGAHTA